MSRYAFLIDSYRTERVKTLSVWSQIPDARMDERLEPRARTAREHMVHQCLSEEAWMTRMLDVVVPMPPVPPALALQLSPLKRPEVSPAGSPL